MLVDTHNQIEIISSSCSPFVYVACERLLLNIVQDMFWWPYDLVLINQSEDWLWKFCCYGDVNVTVLYRLWKDWSPHFHWLIYYWKRLGQEDIRTCLEQSCIISFHKRQKQMESKVKGWILIKLVHLVCVTFVNLASLSLYVLKTLLVSKQFLS